MHRIHIVILCISDVSIMFTDRLLPLLLMLVCIRAQPSATLVSLTSTTQCSSDFLLDSQDTTTITYEISGANANYEFIGIFGPAFQWSSNGMESGPCYLLENDGSCDRQIQVDDCHCELVSSGVYHLTYIKTADIDDSNGTIYIRWPGNPDITLGESHLPEVRASCPTTAAPPTTTVSPATAEISAGTFERVLNCDNEKVVSDHVVATFNLSGSNSDHTFTGFGGPAFYYTNDLDQELNLCPSFEVVTNNCIDRGGEPNQCSCVNQSPDEYTLSYNMTASEFSGKKDIFLRWPGLNGASDLVSSKFSLPDGPASCATASHPGPASDDCDYCCKMGSCKEGCCVGVIIVIIVIVVVCTAVTASVPYYNWRTKGKKKVSKDENTAKEDGSTIFVFGMGSDVTVDRVVQHFSQIGKIKTSPKVWICKDKRTDLPTGEACVTFIDPGRASEAVTRFNYALFEGQVIKVKLVQDGDDCCPGGGGGGGGSTIFVSFMGSDVTEDGVVKHFSQIGTIKTAPEVWIYKGEGTVTFDNPKTAKAAVTHFDGTNFNGQNIKVELAQRENVIRELVELQDTIAVSNLGLDVTEDRVVQHFSQTGIIKTDERTHAPEVWICKDKNTDLPTGEAFVTFIDPGMARAAVARFNGKRFKGKVIEVKLAQIGDRGSGGGGGMGKKDNNEDIELGDRKYKIGGGDGRGDGGGDDEPPPGGNKTATSKTLRPLRNAPPMPPKRTENMTSSTTPAASDQQDSTGTREVKKKQKKTREKGVADMQDQESNVSPPDEERRSPHSASSVRILPTPNISTNGTQHSGLHNQGFTQSTRPPSIDPSSLERHRHGKR